MGICESAIMQKGQVMQTAPLSFQKMQMVAPTFEPLPEPSYYKECGPQLDQKLLTPFQRREISEYEKKKNAAHVYIRKALSDRSKTRKILLGVDYQRGVVGYDNAINPESEIYGEGAKDYLQAKSKKSVVNDMRRGYLGQKTSAMGHSGNILNPDLMSSNVRTEKPYQHKGGDIHAPTFDETYFRVLESNKEVKKVNLGRTQFLRDQDLNGKNYNIITHTDIVQWPSKVNERVHRTMTHPSQTSLEGPRNMQGSIIRSAHL